MIRAIHIEDEPRNVELLNSLVCKHLGNIVKIEGNAKNIKDAIALIKTTQPQLVYLDIELNSGNAFKLLDQLGNFNFQVIFITAFNEFAVKAFRYKAVDYLLKPIDVEELKEATHRAVKKINEATGNENLMEALKLLKINSGVRKIGVPVSDGVVFVETENIIRAEAKGSYTILYLINNKPLTIAQNLKEIEDSLPQNSFLRVHNSWIINIKYLKKYYRRKNSYMEMEDGTIVPVSERKKIKFFEFFNEDKE